MAARPRPKATLARRRRSRAGDEGSVTVEFAVVFPAVLLLILTCVQLALWYHARSLAMAAAQTGVSIARADGRTPADGIAAARRFLDTNAGDALRDATVSAAGSTPTDVRIRVTGHALSVLRGIPVTVDQHAHGPRERFTSRTRP